MVKIASWNVNSVNARLPNVLSWLETAQPDVVLFQELKCMDEKFPSFEFQALGYQSAVHGQKSYNGVAILSKLPLSDIRTGLPGDDEDPQARWIEARVGDALRVGCLYLPNGNPVGTEKFPYKLRWMDRLRARAAELLAANEITVLGGDYNVCPTDDDVYDPEGWQNDALCRPESRAAFRSVLHLGYTEAFRALHKEPGRYTFWDYQGGAWQRDNGLRIDHLLLSPMAADRLQECDVDKEPRSKEKASDHTPIWCTLDLAS